MFKKRYDYWVYSTCKVVDESLDAIQQICEEHGYRIIFGESCYRTGLYGADLRRSKEFEWMMTLPHVMR